MSDCGRFNTLTTFWVILRFGRQRLVLSFRNGIACYVFVDEGVSLDCNFIKLTLHEPFVRQFVAYGRVINFEVALSSHDLAYALCKDLPVLIALVPVVIQHPLCRREIRHYCDAEIMEAEGAVVQNQQRPE